MVLLLCKRATLALTNERVAQQHETAGQKAALSEQIVSVASSAPAYL